MHPLCASRLRVGEGDGHCEEQWQKHVERSVRSPSVQSHVCRLGLRCSCLPIYYGATLLGVAKCVTDPATDRRQFSSAVQILELAISKASQDLWVSVRSEELENLRKRTARLQEIRSDGRLEMSERPPAPSFAATANGSLICRALECIDRHYLEHDVNLTAISRDLGVTEKYLTNLFTRVVGQRMHAYILQLRIQHATRQILLTRKPIKQIAYDSGFKHLDAFRRSFRKYVGVTASTYRSALAPD